MYEENNVYTNSQKNVAKSSNSSKSLYANTYYYKLDKDSVSKPSSSIFSCSKGKQATELWSFLMCYITR